MDRNNRGLIIAILIDSLVIILLFAQVIVLSDRIDVMEKCKCVVKETVVVTE
jgi:hypothetical protein